MKKNIRAFTVIEIIVAISIVAILLVIAIPQYRLYNANLMLKKETYKFTSFIKEVRMAAKEKCVDIDLYDCGTYGTGYNMEPCAVGLRPDTPSPHAWIQTQWLSPVCAATAPPDPMASPNIDDTPSVNTLVFSTQMMARSNRINYLKIYTPASGMAISSNYIISRIMTITPNGFRNNSGGQPEALYFCINSETTPKVYYITINNTGVCGIASDGLSNPGASGSE